MKSFVIALTSFSIGVIVTLLMFTPASLNQLQLKVYDLVPLTKHLTLAPQSQLPNQATKQNKTAESLFIPNKNANNNSDNTNNNDDFDGQFIQFKQLIKQQSFTEALDLYLEMSVDKRFHQFIYHYLFELTESKEIEALSITKTLTNQLINLEYDDFYFRYLNVKANYYLALYPEALALIIELVDQVEDEKYQEAVDFYYRQIIEQYTQQLLNLTKVTETENFIAQLTYLHEYERIEQLNQHLEKIQKAAALANSYPIKIPVTAYGGQLEHGIVTVTLNNNVTVNLMIDSGASYIALDNRVIEQLTYNIIKSDVSFNTANGTIHTDLINIDSFAIGELKIENITASAHYADAPLSTPAFDGLLGRNFLNLFNWYHDTDKSILYLQPK
ncbi:retropepsin-like aspartic protease family protein [Thalassotalea agariperforans]